jgi:hypothetical protein
MYTHINYAYCGGERLLIQVKLDMKKLKMRKMLVYDMDEMVNERQIEEFLSDVDIEFEYLTLFDPMEDEIPLSRLVNKILPQLTDGYDGLIIKEDKIKTIAIKEASIEKAKID